MTYELYEDAYGDARNARTLAWAADIAYLNETEAQREFKEQAGMAAKLISADNTQAYVATNEMINRAGAHAGMDITECTTCHHKLQPEDTVVQPCHECHLHEAESEKEEDPPKTKIAFHTRCTGCHQYTIDQGMEAGPVRKKCKLCHIKPDKK